MRGRVDGLGVPNQVVVRVGRHHAGVEDGQLVMSRTGMNTYNDAKGPYLKLGLYKFTWKSKAMLTSRREFYFDGVNIAKGPSTVLAIFSLYTYGLPHWCYGVKGCSFNDVAFYTKIYRSFRSLYPPAPHSLLPVFVDAPQQIAPRAAPG